MHKFKTLLFILIILSSFQTVFAQNIAQNFPQFPFGTFYNVDALATFLGVPADWLGVPKVIYYIIIPFIVATTVTYGILTELRIFRSTKGNRINILLSIAMAFLLLPSGVLTTIVTYFYAANAFIGLMGFGILFLFGIIMWVYGTGHRLWAYGKTPKDLAHEVSDINREIERHHQAIEQLQAQYLEEPELSPGRRKTLRSAIAEHQNSIAQLQARKTQIHQAMQSI